MIHVVALFKNGQAIVYSVSAGKTAAFKTDSRKQRVGFDNLLHRRRASSGFQRQLGLYSFFHQRIKTQFRQRHGRFRGLSACTGHRIAVSAGAGLKISGQGVAYSRNGQSDRRLGNDVGIHDDHVRIGRKKQVFLKYAFVRIEYGQCAAWRVG